MTGSRELRHEGLTARRTGARCENIRIWPLSTTTPSATCRRWPGRAYRADPPSESDGDGTGKVDRDQNRKLAGELLDMHAKALSGSNLRGANQMNPESYRRAMAELMAAFPDLGECYSSGVFAPDNLGLAGDFDSFAGGRNQENARR